MRAVLAAVVTAALLAGAGPAVAQQDAEAPQATVDAAAATVAELRA